MAEKKLQKKQSKKNVNTKRVAVKLLKLLSYKHNFFAGKTETSDGKRKDQLLFLPSEVSVLPAILFFHLQNIF